MAGKLDTFLKLSIIVSVLMASASVGYYYLVYLPRRDAQLDFQHQLERKGDEAEKRQERARAEAERSALREQVLKELEARQAAEKAAAQERYQDCLRLARSDYEATWAASCKEFGDIFRKSRNDCIKEHKITAGDMKKSKQECGSWDQSIAEYSSSTCNLPRPRGTDIAASHEKARDRCLQENKAGLQ